MKLEILVCAVILTLLLASGVDIITTLVRKLAAERRFITLISSATANTQLRQLWDEVMKDGVATWPEVHQLVRSLEQLSSGLSERDRALISQGLLQRSMIGRSRYVAKVFNKAGIGDGVLPVPIAQ